MKVKAVLFDAGGTLVLQNPELMGPMLGVELDREACFGAHYRAMDAYSRLWMAAGTSRGWEWWLERYFTMLEVPSPSTAGPRIRLGHGLWNLPIPGVESGVTKLLKQGIRCAVISNSDGSIRASLEEAGLSHLFEFVIDSAEVGCKKPQPEIFALGLQQLGGLSPQQVAYVGDSLFHDVNGALGAGYGQAWLVDPLHLYPEQEARVASVAELCDAMKSRNGDEF